MMARSLKAMQTTRELAKELGVSEMALRAAVQRGHVEPSERIGSAMLFDEDAVQRAKQWRSSVDPHKSLRHRQLTIEELPLFELTDRAASRVGLSERHLRRLVVDDADSGNFGKASYVRTAAVDALIAKRAMVASGAYSGKDERRRSPSGAIQGREDAA